MLNGLNLNMEKGKLQDIQKTIELLESNSIWAKITWVLSMWWILRTKPKHIELLKIKERHQMEIIGFLEKQNDS